MRTDALINALVKDTRMPPALAATLPLAVATAGLGAGVLFLAGMGVRPNLAPAISHLPVLVKHVFPLMLLVSGLFAASRLSRPEARPGPALAALAAGPLLVTLAVLVEAVALPFGAWDDVIFTASVWTCLTFVPLMSVPVLLASLYVLRRGASVRPRLSGAVAGLLSSGTAASVYAFYCTQDSPLFYGLWYGIGIAAVTGVGAILGGRLLRW